MGFLDKLFGNAPKNIEISGEKRSQAVNNPSIPAQMSPDKPRPFGYKTSWICVKCGSSEQVIDALGLKNAVQSNWEFGLSQTGDKVFVSPPLDGYVLAVGYDTFGKSSVDKELETLRAIAAKFDEVQCFCSHRVSDFYAWAKFVNGQLVRGYVWDGGDGMVSLNKGELTPDEENLGFDSFIKGDGDDWESVEFPDEENVIEIAAAWGIDPLFDDNDYPEAFGYVCEK